MASEPLVDRICQNPKCGITFPASAPTVRAGGGKYCSPKCFYTSPRDESLSKRRRREVLRNSLLPRLAPGVTLPSAAAIGRQLGVTAACAGYDLRAILREAGVKTRMALRPTGGTRVVVVAMPEKEGVADEQPIG